MAKAMQLKSGKWRVQVYVGKDNQGNVIRKSVTASSKREAEELAKRMEIQQKKGQNIDRKDMTVRDAVSRFLEIKRKEESLGKISPSTMRGYVTIYNNSLDGIGDYPVLSVNDRIINAWLSDLQYVDEYSAKSVKNAWSLVRSSLMEVLPRSQVIDWRIELPSLGKKKVNVPSEDDIDAVIDYLKEKDPDLFRAVLLSAFGTLRRSEIAPLTAEDITGNVIHINKAVVRSTNGDWVLKGTKTEMSTRDVVLPQFVIDAMPKEGYLVGIDPARITDRFIKTLKKLDKRHFRFHDLRHYSASIMHALGASNEIIMSRGGWSNDQTLNAHYRGTISEYEKDFTEKLNEHFTERFGA